MHATGTLAGLFDFRPARPGAFIHPLWLRPKTSGVSKHKVKRLSPFTVNALLFVADEGPLITDLEPSPRSGPTHGNKAHKFTSKSTHRKEPALVVSSYLRRKRLSYYFSSCARRFLASSEAAALRPCEDDEHSGHTGYWVPVLRGITTKYGQEDIICGSTVRTNSSGDPEVYAGGAWAFVHTEPCLPDNWPKLYTYLRHGRKKKARAAFLRWLAEPTNSYQCEGVEAGYFKGGRFL